MTDRDLILQLVAARKASGLTQSAVARRCYVTTSCIGAFETANRSPTLATIIRYANAIGYTINLTPGADE